MTRPLDFVIIGAQKAGTTSLHKYLERHPRLFLPAEKEAYFFSHDDRYTRGVEWLVREYYRSAPSDRLWGKATPQYMADGTVPERLAAAMPDVRLIAVLRNPIDRAFSHFRMTVRRGVESRSFAEAIEQLALPGAVERSRRLRVGPAAEPECYLVWGEYGRILSGYLTHFPRSQLLPVFTEDLLRDPQTVIDAITAYLGLGTGFVPGNLSEQYHRGGERERIPWLRGLVRRPPLSFVWASLPNRLRRYIGFWGSVANVRHERNELDPLAPEIRRRLAGFYHNDVERLRGIVGTGLPWPDFEPGPGRPSSQLVLELPA